MIKIVSLALTDRDIPRRLSPIQPSIQRRSPFAIPSAATTVYSEPAAWELDGVPSAPAVVLWTLSSIYRSPAVGQGRRSRTQRGWMTNSMISPFGPIVLKFQNLRIDGRIVRRGVCQERLHRLIKFIQYITQQNLKSFILGFHALQDFFEKPDFRPVWSLNFTDFATSAAVSKTHCSVCSSSMSCGPSCN